MPPISHSPIGRFVPISGFDPRFNEEYHVDACIPDDLPDFLDLPSSTWTIVTAAMTEIGRLDTASRMVPNPYLITRMATRREAIGTSALEGTYANLAEILVAEEIADGAVDSNVQEVLNYAMAAEAAYEQISDRPISTGLISALHAEIVRGTESDGPEAGIIRTSQVFIGAKYRRVSEARFIPPPPGDRLRDLYQEWERWLTDPKVMMQMPVVVRMALAHYQFETLHPYNDGNGRLGRLVAILQLLKDGALSSPVLSVSTWLNDRAEEYRDHLLKVTETGDWIPWIEFFCEAIIEEARKGCARIVRLLELRDELGQKVRAALPKARLALDIVDGLIAFPLLTVASSERRHGRTNQANRFAIQALVDLGILEPINDATYGKAYWNRQVFQVIDS